MRCRAGIPLSNANPVLELLQLRLSNMDQQQPRYMQEAFCKRTVNSCGVIYQCGVFFPLWPPGLRSSSFTFFYHLSDRPSQIHTIFLYTHTRTPGLQHGLQPMGSHSSILQSHLGRRSNVRHRSRGTTRRVLLYIRQGGPRHKFWQHVGCCGYIQGICSRLERAGKICGQASSGGGDGGMGAQGAAA